VKAGQRVAKQRGRQVADHAVEMSEDIADFVRVLGMLHALEGLRARDLRNRPPEITLAIGHPIFATLGLDDFGKLPDAIRLIDFGFELGVAVVRQHPHVLHDGFRYGKNGFPDALDDEALLGKSRPKNCQIGIIDVPGAVRLDADQPPGDVELACNKGGAHGD